MVAAAAVAGAAALTGIPWGGAVAQETEAGDDQAEVVAPLAALEVGERFTSDAWDLEVQDVFVDESRDRTAWSEVRLSVALRNNGPEPLTYSDGAFFDGDGYPRLVLVDENAVARPYRMLRPSQEAVPGSNVAEIPAGLTGRWTIGFQVPTINDGSLRLDALVDGVAVATWTLDSSSDQAGWEPPPIDTVALGDTIDWDGPALLATPSAHGSLVCGDPENEFVTQVFALQMDVSNVGLVDDLAFPGVRQPNFAAVAQWADGATAQLSYETYGGEREVLHKPAADWVLIPATGPETVFPRGFLFGVTRDSRLGTVDDPPQGVLLNRPDGTSLWLDLDGEGDLPVNPAFCDVGLFEGLLPLAFQPAQTFEVGGEIEPQPTSEELNLTTGQLITQAAITVYQAAFNENKNFKQLTAEDMEEAWPNVTFLPGLINANTGLVGFEAITELQMVLMTISPTGEYFCAGLEAGVKTKLAFGTDFDGTLNACLPPDLTEEETNPPAEEGTTTTTTTTVP